MAIAARGRSRRAHGVLFSNPGAVLSYVPQLVCSLVPLAPQLHPLQCFPCFALKRGPPYPLLYSPTLPLPPAAHEMMLCFGDARDDPDIGVIILTGQSLPAYAAQCSLQQCSL